MSSRPFISENGVLCCPHTNKRIKYIDLSTSDYNDATYRLYCSTCARNRLTKKSRTHPDLQKISLQVQQPYNLFVGSLTDPTEEETKADNLSSPNLPSDFSSCEIEHIIFDFNATGYAPRAIAYLEDLLYLVTGDQTGKVIIWDMSKKPKALCSFDEADMIRCIAYVKESDKARYLLFGISNEIAVYKLNGYTPKFKFALTGHNSINHIHYNAPTKRVFSCGWDEIIRIWKVDSFELESQIDTVQIGVPGPMATLHYFEDENSLAIERNGGLSMVWLGQEKPKVEHFEVKGREGYGFTYLAKTKEFLLRSRNTDAWIIDKKTLSKTSELNGNIKSEEFPGHKYVPNEDDTQILANSNDCSLLVYDREEDGIIIISLNGYITRSNGIEFMRNIRKIVVGDENTGLLLILKTGIKGAHPKSAEKIHIKQEEEIRVKVEEGASLPQKENGESSIPGIKRSKNMISKQNKAPATSPEAPLLNVKPPGRRGRPPKKSRRKEKKKFSDNISEVGSETSETIADLLNSQDLDENLDEQLPVMVKVMRKGRSPTINTTIQVSVKGRRSKKSTPVSTEMQEETKVDPSTQIIEENQQPKRPRRGRIAKENKETQETMPSEPEEALNNLPSSEQVVSNEAETKPAEEPVVVPKKKKGRKSKAELLQIALENATQSIEDAKANPAGDPQISSRQNRLERRLHNKLQAELPANTNFIVPEPTKADITEVPALKKKGRKPKSAQEIEEKPQEHIPVEESKASEEVIVEPKPKGRRGRSKKVVEEVPAAQEEPNKQNQPELAIQQAEITTQAAQTGPRRAERRKNSKEQAIEPENNKESVAEQSKLTEYETKFLASVTTDIAKRTRSARAKTVEEEPKPVTDMRQGLEEAKVAEPELKEAPRRGRKKKQPEELVQTEQSLQIEQPAEMKKAEKEIEAVSLPFEEAQLTPTPKKRGRKPREEKILEEHKAEPEIEKIEEESEAKKSIRGRKSSKAPQVEASEPLPEEPKAIEVIEAPKRKGRKPRSQIQPPEEIKEEVPTQLPSTKEDEERPRSTRRGMKQLANRDSETILTQGILDNYINPTNAQAKIEAIEQEAPVNIQAVKKKGGRPRKNQTQDPSVFLDITPKIEEKEDEIQEINFVQSHKGNVRKRPGRPISLKEPEFYDEEPITSKETTANKAEKSSDKIQIEEPVPAVPKKRGRKKKSELLATEEAKKPEVIEIIDDFEDVILLEDEDEYQPEKEEKRGRHGIVSKANRNEVPQPFAEEPQEKLPKTRGRKKTAPIEERSPSPGIEERADELDAVIDEASYITKKRPGRPKKIQPVLKTIDIESDDDDDDVRVIQNDIPSPRDSEDEDHYFSKRGRRRNNRNPRSKEPPSPEEESERKKRGRPKKDKEEERSLEKELDLAFSDRNHTKDVNDIIDRAKFYLSQMRKKHNLLK